MAVPQKTTKPSRFKGLNFIEHPLKKFIKEKKYAWMHQGKGINVLACLCQAAVNNCIKDGDGGFVIKDVKVTFGSDNIYLDGRTQQVLYYIIQLYTSKVGKKPNSEAIMENRNIIINISEVAALFDMTYQGARLMLAKAIETLYHISVSWVRHKEVYKNKKKVSLTQNVKLRFLTRVDEMSLQEKDIRAGKTRTRGCFVVRLEEDFARYLPSASTMWFPLALYRVVPVRQTCAFAFGLRLVLQYRYSKYKKNKFMANFIGVEVLLNSTTELPNHECIKDKGEMARRIIIPFMKGLDALVTVGVLETWNFVNRNTGVAVPMEVIKKIRYKAFIQLYVYFKLCDYPGMEDLDFGSSVVGWLESFGCFDSDNYVQNVFVPVKEIAGIPGYAGAQPTLF